MSGKKFFQSAMGKAVINWAKRTLFPKLKFMPTGGEHENGNLWTQVLPNCYEALPNVRDDG
jgi:2-keto-3-deoxy-6-phosphogluconate aldolase